MNKELSICPHSVNDFPVKRDIEFLILLFPYRVFQLCKWSIVYCQANYFFPNILLFTFIFLMILFLIIITNTFCLTRSYNFKILFYFHISCFKCTMILLVLFSLLAGTKNQKGSKQTTEILIKMYKIYHLPKIS